MLTPQLQKIFALLALFPLALAPALPFLIARWLQHQHNPHVLLGLGSSFWAGVLIGISIVYDLLGLLLVVLLVRSSHSIQDDWPTQG